MQFIFHHTQTCFGPSHCYWPYPILKVFKNWKKYADETGWERSSSNSDLEGGQEKIGFIGKHFAFLYLFQQEYILMKLLENLINFADDIFLRSLGKMMIMYTETAETSEETVWWIYIHFSNQSAPLLLYFEISITFETLSKAFYNVPHSTRRSLQINAILLFTNCVQ